MVVLMPAAGKKISGIISKPIGCSSMSSKRIRPAPLYCGEGRETGIPGLMADPYDFDLKIVNVGGPLILVPQVGFD
jgi:hypothetical protein